MNKVFPLLLLSMVTGCTQVFPYTTVASHTIQVGEKQEADVVWVGDLRDGTLQRCHNSPQGPKCVRVR